VSGRTHVDTVAHPRVGQDESKSVVDQARGVGRGALVAAAFGRVEKIQIPYSPTMKVLLLHGGPGPTHEYLEVFADFLPEAGIEIYLYDQLGSFYSDQPEDPEL